MDIDSWTSGMRSHSDHAMSYSSGGQPPSIGDVRQAVVSQPSGGSTQMYSDGQPPSVNDVGRREPSCSRNDYDSPNSGEVDSSALGGGDPESAKEKETLNLLPISPDPGISCYYYNKQNQQSESSSSVDATTSVGQPPRCSTEGTTPSNLQLLLQSSKFQKMMERISPAVLLPPPPRGSTEGTTPSALQLLLQSTKFQELMSPADFPSKPPESDLPRRSFPEDI